MSTDPAVSVLMGVYNEEKHLEEAIKSICNQNLDDYEFIIVDDNSTDISAEIAKSYEDTRIHFIQNETNRGLTYSLNRALEYATGKYIARQDADDISEPERLNRQVQFLETHDKVAVVGTGVYLIDDNGDVIDHRVGYCNPDFEDFITKSHLVHGSILARRNVLEEVGGYDEFFRYAQDYDLWLRLSKQYQLANIQEPLYRHRIHNKGVYFSQKDESALYGIFARHMATDKIDSKMKQNIQKKGIEQYYNYLSPSEKEAFHQELAVRYLRYGHAQHALNECKKAKEYRNDSVKTNLLSILARTGTAPTELARWAMRRYFNTKIRFKNQISCPYNS